MDKTLRLGRFNAKHLEHTSCVDTVCYNQIVFQAKHLHFYCPALQVRIIPWQNYFIKHVSTRQYRSPLCLLRAVALFLLSLTRRHNKAVFCRKLVGSRCRDSRWLLRTLESLEILTYLKTQEFYTRIILILIMFVHNCVNFDYFKGGGLSANGESAAGLCLQRCHILNTTASVPETIKCYLAFTTS